MSNKTAIAVASLCFAAVAAHSGLSQADFKVRLTHVAVADSNADDFGSATRVSPDKRIVVKPGNLAVFFLEHDIPTNAPALLFLEPNFKEGILPCDPFGTSASGPLSGKGSASRVVILGAGGSEPYERPLLLKSVRVTCELKAKKGEPRNEGFFVCDIPVDVLFANSEDDIGEAVVLEPSPAPAPDPTLGVVKRKKSAASKPSTPVGFTDNLDEALAKAKKEGKLVFACFSGSDWCWWCKKLEEEVLSKPEFVAGVSKDFELVFIDQPEDRSRLSKHAQEANEALVAKYRIDGFPTVLILDGDGKKVGETGYMKGGAEAYVGHIMEFRKK